MLQLIFVLASSTLIFWIMWRWLGARELYESLIRDEHSEIRNELNEAEDRLAELELDTDRDETWETLRLHYEKEVLRLRRRLERSETTAG